MDLSAGKPRYRAPKQAADSAALFLFYEFATDPVIQAENDCDDADN